ncbi:MAG: histidine ammonia-lyase [Spirochaetes bacterium]|nr:histidine ammonia-lyase [Spirochaetota bacterium]
MNPVTLTGDTLTFDDFYRVVFDNAPVNIAGESLQKLEKGRKVLFDLASSGMQIYGMNVGVGWNKDKSIPQNFYPAYNRNLILAHCVGLPPYASENDVRAMLLARLNIMLIGSSGASPELAQFYAEMLNRRIHPLVPETGSVGQADIGLMSFVGLAVIGEGQVFYKGQVTGAKEALAQEGLAPMQLGPKEGLSIVSSNGVGLGQAALVIKEIETALSAANTIYCASLEALNGNVSPFDPRALKLKRDAGSLATGETLREHLKGSFLHESDSARPLQDPLCFRNTVHIHGALREMLDYTKERLLRAINAGEDNPSLLIDEMQVIPTSNFEPVNWVLGMEALAIGLSHVANASCLRTIKLANPAFTGLPRFLTPEGDSQVLGFATIQKTYTAQYAKIRHLAAPASLDSFPLAGEIEDKGTNSPYVVQRLRQITDALFDILALELLHAAQGQDFRLQAGKTLGAATGKAHASVRAAVSFLSADRVLAYDILALKKIIVSGKLI